MCSESAVSKTPTGVHVAIGNLMVLLMSNGIQEVGVTMFCLPPLFGYGQQLACQTIGQVKVLRNHIISWNYSNFSVMSNSYHLM